MNSLSNHCCTLNAGTLHDATWGDASDNACDEWMSHEALLKYVELAKGLEENIIAQQLMLSYSVHANHVVSQIIM